MEDTIAQDEKDAIREEMMRDEFHERNMRTDFEYFLEKIGFDELKAVYKKDEENSEEVQSLYGKLNAKTWEYGWFCDLKDFL